MLPPYLEGLGIEYHVVEEDTCAAVKALTFEGMTCYPIRSRLRRSVLYAFAKRSRRCSPSGTRFSPAASTKRRNTWHQAI